LATGPDASSRAAGLGPSGPGTVQSTTAAGDSPPSQVVSATTAIDPPSAPSITTVISSSSQIDLSWNDVATATGYRVERSSDGATGWAPVATLGQDGTTYSDTGLSAGTTYSYRVFATNAAGDSPPSQVVSATTMALTHRIP
jgi:large repetitive protein